MPQANHRDRLLRGALECLQANGYARTTARDIAAAADANLASIGYHFGSKEALLNEALIQASEEWTRRISAAAFAAEGASPLERMVTAWKEMLGSFEENGPLLIAFIDATSQAAHSDELRAQLAQHYAEIREAVAGMVRTALGDDPEQLGADPEVIASFLIAVCDGFVVQWLLDPARTPDGEQLVSALGSALALALQLGAAEEGARAPQDAA
jgi:AcrR family transcriptional regulator